MKSSARIAIVMFALFALSASSKALAQTNDEEVEANIPFKFYAGHALLPAGKYLFKIDAVAENVLSVNNDNARVSVFLEDESTDSVQPATRTYVSFNKIGNEYFLSDLRIAGEDSGVHIAKSHMELRAEGKGLAKVQTSIEAHHKTRKG